MINPPVKYFKLNEHPLTKENFKDIQLLLDKFPLEDVTVGDAGEINRCKVGRLMEDKINPTILNEKLSKEVFKIIFKDNIKEFILNNFNFKESSEQLVVRRCQFNLLGKDAFVGKHLDTDSNPDYELAVIFQLGSKFEGGEFKVFDYDDSIFYKKKPEYCSISFSNCSYKHSVEPVSSGVRTSLVMFVTKYNGPNQRD